MAEKRSGSSRPVSEGRRSDEIRLVLSKHGIVSWRNSVGFDHDKRVRYGLAVGSADLIACVRGRMVGIEVKTPIGKLSADQVMWQRLLEQHGGLFIVLRSAEEAEAWCVSLVASDIS